MAKKEDFRHTIIKSINFLCSPRTPRTPRTQSVVHGEPWHEKCICVCARIEWYVRLVVYTVYSTPYGLWRGWMCMRIWFVHALTTHRTSHTPCGATTNVPWKLLVARSDVVSSSIKIPTTMARASVCDSMSTYLEWQVCRSSSSTTTPTTNICYYYHLVWYGYIIGRMNEHTHTHTHSSHTCCRCFHFLHWLGILCVQRA